MQKITTFLWFNDQAEEAMNHYITIFGDGKVVHVNRAAGRVVAGTFELFGQRFIALNGGPMYKFTEAISLFVDCETQEEVDRLWTKLSEGGEPGRCGWLKDKYGVSWQIIPRALMQLMGDPDPKKSGAVVQAMMKMNKIEIAELQRAYEAA